MNAILFVVLAMVLACMFGCISETSADSGVVSATAKHASEFRTKADRVVEIYKRGGLGGDVDPLTAREALRVSADDFLLIGCANASSARNFPGVPQETRTEFGWFAGGDDLTREQAGFNYHASQRHDGTWQIESYYSNLVRPEFRASPEEVAWHYIRLKELRAAGVPQPERVATMTTEAKSRPWEQMR